ncbi:MAG: DsbA family protein [Gammaproteobacteria bacterium]|nr:DsbA family protein [Gammaproteobacteria bacterium]
MQIDMISDVVCVWCYVGKNSSNAKSPSARNCKRRFAGFPISCIRKRQPRAIPAARNHRERKYGRQMIDGMFARLTAAGKAVGIEFQLDRIARSA